MRTAILCSGLGRVERGFEAFYEDLFGLLRDCLNVTVFQTGGQKSSQRRVLQVSDRAFYQRLLRCSWQRAYRYEQVGFAVAALPALRRGKFDLLHFSDWLLGKWLRFFQRRGWISSALLVTDGAWLGPAYAQYTDFVHYLTPEQHTAALEAGLAPARTFLIPHGIHCGLFGSRRSESVSLRERYRVPRDRKVVLCVAAIERTHKRVDWLIQEAAALDQDRHFLLIAGNRGAESDELERRAQELLGQNFRFTTVPRSQVADLYALADVFVLPSVREGFGIALLEAMASGLPILAHNNPHFRWLTGREECLVDMETPGALASRITWITSHPAEAEALAQANYREVTRRFDWAVLRDDYLAMYARIYEHVRSF